MKPGIRVKYRRKEALRVLNRATGQYESQRRTWRFVRYRFSDIVRRFDSESEARLYVYESKAKNVLEYRIEVLR